MYPVGVADALGPALVAAVSASVVGQYHAGKSGRSI